MLFFCTGMIRTKYILCITFAFCLTTVGSEIFYKKLGDVVQMDCTGANPTDDIEWKFNGILVLGKSRSGLSRKGGLEISSRARIDRTSLKVQPLKTSDSGVYTCRSSSHTLYVASAHADPASVLYSTETKLLCDIAGGIQGTFEWLTPSSVVYSATKEKTVNAKISDNAGRWTCQIKDDKGRVVIRVEVDISVVGPLNTQKEVNAYQGDTAVLPCFLPSPSTLPITGGTWSSESPTNIRFPTLVRTANVVAWNNTDVDTTKVTFSNQELKADFSVTLKKVKSADTGVYVCKLVFEGGKSMSTSLNLKVLKRDGAAPDVDSEEPNNNIFYKYVLGLQIWVWIVLGALLLFIIIIGFIILLVYRRNKMMKRKIKKLKSMRQPLTSRNYCKCDRTVKQPGTGKRERPPPLPSYQYSSY